MSDNQHAFEAKVREISDKISPEKRVAWAKDKLKAHLTKWPIDHPQTFQILESLSVNVSAKERGSINEVLHEMYHRVYSREVAPVLKEYRAQVLRGQGVWLLSSLNDPLHYGGEWFFTLFCSRLVHVRSLEILRQGGGRKKRETAERDLSQKILRELEALLGA